MTRCFNCVFNQTVYKASVFWQRLAPSTWRMSEPLAQPRVTAARVLSALVVEAVAALVFGIWAFFVSLNDLELARLLTIAILAVLLGLLAVRIRLTWAEEADAGH